MAFNFKQAWKAFREPSLPPAQQRSSSVIRTYLGLDDSEGTNQSYTSVSRKAFEQNVVGNRCVSLIANAVGSLCWNLYQGDDEIERHPLLDLINRPNVLQGKSTFFGLAIGSYLLDGNMYIERVMSGAGKPLELWNLRPDYVQIMQNRSRVPTAYIYTPGMAGGARKTYEVNPLTGECDLLHVMPYSPLYETNVGRGYSPIRSAWWSLLTHSSGQRWNYALIENGARPSGAFVTPNGLSDEQFVRVSEQIAESHAGAKNAGKQLVLEGGLSYEEMGLSPKDMDFVNGKNSSAADIALSLGVPPQLVGIQGSLTFANYEQARLAFYEDTVLPLGDMLVDELNRWLVPKFGKGLKLAIDEDEIIALEPKREKKWERANAATFLTINERRQMVGYDDIGPAGDSVMIPTSVLPLGEEIDDTEPAPSDDEGVGE